MKRSQVVNKIKSILDNLNSVQMSNKLKSDIILTELENLGIILPPEHTLLRKYTSGEGATIQYHEYYETLTEWEKENE